MRGMTTGLSRRMGLSAEEKKPEAEHHEPEPGAEGPGVRDWLHELPRAEPGRRAAAFDTRAELKMAGGAAPTIARRLRRHGYELVVEPEGFIIEDTEGPLRAGEAEPVRNTGPPSWSVGQRGPLVRHTRAPAEPRRSPAKIGA